MFFDKFKSLALKVESRCRFKLASFKADQRPYRSSAANHVGAWALLFLPTCPAAADWTLLIDERSFFQKEYCLLHFSLKKNFAKTF